MNRQTKRMLQRQGADRPRAPERRAAPQVQREKTSPRQFFAEVKGELKKVAWPSQREVVNSTIAVLICVILMGALIFALDYGSAKFVLFLFD